MTDTVVNTAIRIISEFEGFRGLPYKCPAGVWTIGYGSTYYPDGTLVSPQDPPISRNGATRLLEYHVRNVMVPTLARTVPTWGIMNNYQRAALLSFAYNLGTHFYGGSNFNTITKALSSPTNLKNVPSALALYVNPGSSFEAGLRRRRQEEASLWNGQGKYAQ